MSFAQWKYFKKHVSLPILLLSQTGISGHPKTFITFLPIPIAMVLCAEDRHENPWLAQLYSLFKQGKVITPEQRLSLRSENNKLYFNSLKKAYLKKLDETKTLKRLKALIRYSFEDYEDGENFKRTLLRSSDFNFFTNEISTLQN